MSHGVAVWAQGDKILGGIHEGAGGNSGNRRSVVYLDRPGPDVAVRAAKIESARLACRPPDGDGCGAVAAVPFVPGRPVDRRRTFGETRGGLLPAAFLASNGHERHDGRDEKSTPAQRVADLTIALTALRVDAASKGQRQAVPGRGPSVLILKTVNCVVDLQDDVCAKIRASAQERPKRGSANGVGVAHGREHVSGKLAGLERQINAPPAKGCAYGERVICRYTAWSKQIPRIAVNVSALADVALKADLGQGTCSTTDA